jgi:Fe-S cluster assembly protein SufB
MQNFNKHMFNQKLPSDSYRFGFHNPENYFYKSDRGLSEKVVIDISHRKNEPDWMTKFRLNSYRVFCQKKIPSWGVDLAEINFDNFYYYIKPIKDRAETWAELPSDIKDTYDRIGIPKAEKDYLSGVSAQYESEVVYKSVTEMLQKKGVIFLDMDSGLREYPDLVRKYFGTVVPSGDNKFAALNSSVWSGGSFIYVPPNIKIELPLQAYFRINAANMGQFERTLIIVGEGSYIHYVEGCTAPVYSTDSLHSAVVEIIVGKGARMRYTTIQNWSKNIFNLVTKRARVEEEGIMEWVDGNIGSKITMKYPSIYLVGRKSHGEVLSVAVASSGQHQDTGGKVVHLASETTSEILSKSIVQNGGRASYRGLVCIPVSSANCKSHVVCDALIMDDNSRSDTYPTMDIKGKNNVIEHEATVSKIGDEQLFYLKSRGLNEEDARSMIVNGFIEPIVKELPLEYAVELNRLMSLQMTGTVG